MNKIEKIVVASTNPAKVERYGKMLAPFTNQILGLNDFPKIEKPEESGQTAKENAEIKGKYYAKKTNCLVFSEDEALYVDFLPEDKQPGVHVRRINGKDEASDQELFSYWEKIVSNVPKNQRTGQWHIAYCLTTPDGKSKTVSLDHPIVFYSPPSDVRIPGWPMSSLEGPKGFNKPHSEMTDEEKKQSEQKANQAISQKIAELLKEA